MAARPVLILSEEVQYNALTTYAALTYPGAHGSDSDPSGPLYGSWDFSSGGSSSPPPASGTYTIHPNGDESKCLDVEGANYANGTPVDM